MTAGEGMLRRMDSSRFVDAILWFFGAVTMAVFIFLAVAVVIEAAS